MNFARGKKKHISTSSKFHEPRPKNRTRLGVGRPWCRRLVESCTVVQHQSRVRLTQSTCGVSALAPSANIICPPHTLHKHRNCRYTITPDFRLDIQQLIHGKVQLCMIMDYMCAYYTTYYTLHDLQFDRAHWSSRSIVFIDMNARSRSWMLYILYTFSTQQVDRRLTG